MRKEKQKQQSKVTLDDLALMIQQGFMEVQDQFRGVQDQFQGVEKQFQGMRDQFQVVFKKLDVLGAGQKMLQQDMEFVKLRLDSKADRFELKTLETRIERLERA